MRVGAIAFYTNSHIITNQLTIMNMPLEQFTLLTDEEFYQIHGVKKEVPLLLLLTHSECWGFVAKKINRRNGQTAWRIVNHKDNFKEVPEDEILLTLNLDGYAFKNWDEMASSHSLARSKGGSPIRKSPSETDKNTSVKGDFIVFKNSKLLHQLVESNDPHYSKNNPFNTQWEAYNPHYLEPKNYKEFYKSMTNPMSYYPHKKKTLHAIPFLRNNIRPTKLSVFIKPKEPVPTPRLFFNYPEGIPTTFA